MSHGASPMNNDNPIDPYELRADAASIRSGIYPGSAYPLNNALADVLILLTRTVEYLVDTVQAMQTKSPNEQTITVHVDGRELAQAIFRQLSTMTRLPTDGDTLPL